MKKVFAGSLCYEGTHSGELCLYDDYMIFRTKKLELPESYKRINMSYFGIASVSRCRSFLLFPAIKVRLKNAVAYKFILFGRRRCLRLLEEKGVCLVK